MQRHPSSLVSPWAVQLVEEEKRVQQFSLQISNYSSRPRTFTQYLQPTIVRFPFRSTSIVSSSIRWQFRSMSDDNIFRVETIPGTADSGSSKQSDRLPSVHRPNKIDKNKVQSAIK